MIKTIKGKRAASMAEGKPAKGFPEAIFQSARRKMAMIDKAVKLDDLRAPPGNRLEVLTGDRAGQQSIRINNQWRICFLWRDGDAYDVEIVDYH